MSKKRGGFALIILGVVIAVGVALLVFGQAQRAAETARLESVDVLVAAQDIPERTVMAAPFVSVKRMLPTSLPPNALVRPEDAIGKMTTGPILAGEFILPGKLVGADGHAGVSYVVPKGKVVITMPASDILTTGAVRAGDTVDLLVTIKPDTQQKKDSPSDSANGAKAAGTPVAQPSPTPAATDDVGTATTQTTMQNLKILAVGAVAPDAPVEGKAKDANGNTPTAGLITFAVERQDALVLKALKDSERVKVEMVLRSAADDLTAKTDPVTLKTIMDRYDFRAVATPAGTPVATPVAGR